MTNLSVFRTSKSPIRFIFILLSIYLGACQAGGSSAPVAWNNVSSSQTFPDLGWDFSDKLENLQITRFSPPAVSDGVLYFVADPDHRDWNRTGSVPKPYIIALDEATGQLKWKTGMDGIGLINDAPIVQAGVVIGRTAGNMEPNQSLSAFDIHTGQLLWTLSDTFPAGRTWDQNSFCTSELKDNPAGDSLQELDYACLDWHTGKPVSDFKIVEKDGWNAGASGVAVSQSVLFVRQTDQLLAYQLPAGAIKFQAPMPDGGYDLLAANGLVYSNDDYMTAYDANTGARRWRITQKVGRAQSMIISDDGMLFVLPEADLATALLAIDGQSGAIRWSFDPGSALGKASLLQIIGATVYVAYGDNGPLLGAKYLYALDRKSGQVKWKYEQPDFDQSEYNTSRIILPVAELNGVVYLTAWLSDGGGSYANLRSSTLFRLDAAKGSLISTTTLLVKPETGDYSHVGDLLSGVYALHGRIYLPTAANRIINLQTH